MLGLTSQTVEPGDASFDNSDEIGAGMSATDLRFLRGYSLTSNDYISLTKSLVGDVMDEANLDSVRALSAMVSHRNLLNIK